MMCITCPHFGHENVGVAASGLPLEWRAYAEWNGWMIEMNIGNPRDAVAWSAACTKTCAEVEEPGWLRRLPVIGQAVSHHLLGETDEAIRAALRARAIPVSPYGRIEGQVMAIEVAPALAAGGDEELAKQVLRDATLMVRRLGTPLAENHLLSMFAYVEYLRGRPERAGRLLGAARYLAGAADLPVPFRTPGSMSLYRHYLPIVRAALGPDEARRARNEGRAMTLDGALAYALDGLG